MLIVCYICDNQQHVQVPVDLNTDTAADYTLLYMDVLGGTVFSYMLLIVLFK